ncbi:PQQ-binding-like beta-propeller repeat protein [Cellulomonas sp. JZ18]|uniref:outer membrane protein assembly factor BamB family protein n=1 Tax=Cellulomonas sp. JZ18 TaxID=2654191 RepID=UPI0012D452D8|nr:PQQ-binding-like beta-propeller repeat protein [Cellulomonas sp. JZ18]QGQ20524.1 PQQ-binding-like beta-propeller repeat protein [Cellulomonas sp. JZ18]
MARGRGSQAAVELVEEGVEGAVPGDDAAPPVARRPRLRHWRWAAGAGVLAVAVAALAQAWVERADEQRLARVAGVGPSLEEPLVQSWQAGFRGSVGVHEDTLIAVAPDGQGIVALDARDGTVRWRQERVTEASMCQLTSQDAPPAVAATGPTAGTAAPEPVLVACFSSGGSGATTVHVLDPATGSLEQTLLVGDGTSSWTLSGADLVVIGVSVDEHVTAGRWSLRTGEQRWSYRSPDALPGGHAQQSFALGDDLLTASFGSWEVVLDARTGEVVADAAHGDREVVVEPGTGRALPTEPSDEDPAQEVARIGLEDGAVAVVRLGDGSVRTEVSEADGTVLWERDGHVFPPAVDDGTAPGLLLMTSPEGGGLQGVDARSGHVRWEQEAVGSGATGQPLVLSSLVLVPTGSGRSASGGSTGMVALDSGSGAVVWEHTAGDVAGWDVVTDGHRVLTLEDGDGAAHLVARDVRTGTVVWSVRAPADAHSLWPLGDHGVLVVGDDHWTAFRPPDGRTR